jgi:parallel beta-helix repeat protein
LERKTVSGIMLTLLLIGMLTLTFNIQTVKASGTIYIRADGSIDPPDAPIYTEDNITYTFTDNIYNEIVVERSSIIIDGAGFTLDGTEAFFSKGIYLRGINNVTIKNINIQRFWFGVKLFSSNYNNIYGNNITSNIFSGVEVDYSKYNSIYGNIIANNWDGIEIIWSSNYNNVYRNIITHNIFSGIDLVSASYNSIYRNIIANTLFDGIQIGFYSDHNIIYGNNIANNWDGIFLCPYSDHNVIYENHIANNIDGIYVWHSSYNIVYHNNFINNTYHVYTDYQTTDRYRRKYWQGRWYGTGKGVYPAPIVDRVNVWDDGYPSGGNYWSDYEGNDLYRGPNQDDHGRDGIGDTPYTIDENNLDNYPLMHPWGSRQAAIWTRIRNILFTKLQRKP